MLKVILQSLLIGFALLVLHWFGHVWPTFSEDPQIIELFSGPMMIVYYLLNVLAFPIHHLLGWTWVYLGDLNLVGPVLLGFLVTGLLMRRKNKKAGASNV